MEPAAHRYSWYIVLVLMVCFTCSFIDRQILSLLVGPIKADLHLSDTQFGLLQGFAFAVFYTLVGIPLGRWADVGNRRTMIAIGTAVWSVMTTLSAVARSFPSLFLARIGVGIGEATLSPAAFSMLSDSFSRERLSKAISVYTMGIFIGSGLALIIGGMVVQATSSMGDVTLPLFGTIAPWRLTFLIVGLPGLLIALWVWSLREPLRKSLLRGADGEVSKVSFREATQQIGSRWASFIPLALGMVFQSMVVFAFTAWAPAYFQRVHHWSPQLTGQWLGIIILTFGCLGMYVGGSLADHWRRRGHADSGIRVLLISAIGVGLCFVPAFLLKDPVWTLILLAPALFFEGMPIGSAFASVQLIFPNQARGAAAALFMFILNLGGISLGPLLPALFTDRLFRSELRIGESLSLTMAIASVSMLVLFTLARAPYRRHYHDLEARLADPAASSAHG